MQAPPDAPPSDVDPAALEDEICWRHDRDVERADAVIAGTYHFPPHDPVELGTDLNWLEDPLEDRNWQFQFHALRWLWPLMSAYEMTEDPSYLEAATGIARDWVESNPRDTAEAPFAWNDHSTAWRALVLSCLDGHLDGDDEDWLEEALSEHAATLADPSFYVDHGNHALNQDIGLLAIACRTELWPYRDLAAERIGVLVTDAVDEQGWTDEQAIEYQDYNHGRYVAALKVLDACGVPAPPWADRVELMPSVLAHAVLPDGTYVTLGDTDRRDVKDLDEPAIQYVRSAGERGTAPADTAVSFDAGFAFVRSGWGVDRPFEDESMVSLRFGPRPRLHGHDDHGSITFFADGQRLLVDPGKYLYGDTPGRAHVLSRDAHNVVTTGPCADPPSEPSRLATDRATADGHLLQVDVAMCDDASWSRQLLVDAGRDTVIVVDHVTWSGDEPAAQGWQLELGAEVDAADPADVVSSWPDGATLRLEQLGSIGVATVVAGGEEPLRGWVSPRYGDLQPAPQLRFEVLGDDPSSGRHTARLVTVLRAGDASDGPRSTVDDTSPDELVVTTPSATYRLPPLGP